MEVGRGGTLARTRSRLSLRISSSPAPGHPLTPASQPTPRPHSHFEPDEQSTLQLGDTRARTRSRSSRLSSRISPSPGPRFLFKPAQQPRQRPRTHLELDEPSSLQLGDAFDDTSISHFTPAEFADGDTRVSRAEEDDSMVRLTRGKSKDVSTEKLTETILSTFPEVITILKQAQGQEDEAREQFRSAAKNEAETKEAYVATKESIGRRLPSEGPWRKQEDVSVTRETLEAGRKDIEEEIALCEALQAVTSRHSAAARRLGTDHSTLLVKKRKANDDVNEAMTQLEDADETRKAAKRARKASRKELEATKKAIDASVAYTNRWYASIKAARAQDDAEESSGGEESSEEDEENDEDDEGGHNTTFDDGTTDA